MRKIIIILFCAFVFPISVSFAVTPPSQEALFPIQSVSLAYDLKTTTLHVDAAHPSDNWERDYVRMMTVSLNGQVVSTQNYYHQTTPAGFSEDVTLKAQVGDVIMVEVFSTQGNSISQSLTVTQPEAARPDQGVDAGADNSATNSTIGNMAN